MFITGILWIGNSRQMYFEEKLLTQKVMKEALFIKDNHSQLS